MQRQTPIHLRSGKPAFIIDRLNALDERRRQLQDEIYRLEFQLADLGRRVDDARVVMDILDNFRHEFDKAPAHQRKDLMKLLVKEVAYTPTEIILGVYDDIEELGFRVDDGTGGGTGENGSGGGKASGRTDGVLFGAPNGSPGRSVSVTSSSVRFRSLSPRLANALASSLAVPG